jgi:hypothetical protein
VSESIEVTAVVVGLDVLAEHPELHHYTDGRGLEGIIGSNMLWATHYADLNDGTEIVHLRDLLRGELVERFRRIVQRVRVRSKVDRAVRQAGGLAAAATSVADDLIKSLYDSAFERDDNVSEISRTAGSAFIFSLCTHSTEPYERANGLLSQWRGYGHDGGFCLVFDTARLAEMLGDERDVSAYTHLNLHPAVYAFEDLSLSQVYPDLITACEVFLETALDGKADLGMGIEQFFVAATTLKHRAFYEEREVRVVAIPTTAAFRTIIESEHSNANLGPQKTIKRLDRQNKPARRYIALLDTLDARLPIKRIIVGPSSDQASRVSWAREICGGSIPVVASETPYKG